MNRFQFVADHQDTYGVKRLCQILEITRSSFYSWQTAAPTRADRAAADAELVAGSGRCTTTTAPTGPRGSPPSSTTASLTVSGSTTSGSRG